MADVLKQGIKLYKSGKYGEALKFFLGVSSDSLESKNELAYYLGLSYARLNKFEEALLYLEQVVTNGTDKEKINQCTLALAVIYSMTDRSKMAEFELGKLAEKGINTDQFLCTKGYVAWYRDEIDKAIECYEQVLAHNPENSTALNGLGYILTTTGKDYTRALFLCKKAHDLNPNSAAYLDSLGWVYFNLGLFAEAETFVNKAYKLFPQNEEIQEHLKEIKGVR
ncbi:MAG: tetratricopeptide repeat protein [Treponemataceae bacterium]